MIVKNAHKNITWIDVSNPNRDEIREIADEYDISPIVADALLSPSPKPTIELYKDYIYLVLHFSAVKHSHAEDPDQEVNFVIGKDFLITVRYDEIDPLHKFAKIFEVNSILGKDEGAHAGFVFYHMIRKLYASLMHEIEYINDQLHAIEDEIFSSREKEMVLELSEASRSLLNMKHALNSHENILRELRSASDKFFGKKFDGNMQHILNDYHKVDEVLLHSREFMIELRETNNSMLQTKQNEVTQVLTVIAFITLPLSLLASVLGMNTRSNPFSGVPHDFWAIVTLMVVLGLIMIVYFKRKNWL
ncbi:hypothetical protein COB55_02905 [Candidatus Wolfebacteria bacterium]|nr:MAG: hypothetical protein COB55_02905 [Candidatus Wolfebacteria bacterium]